MANPQATQALSLEIRRTVQAPREKVYAAWTVGKLFAQWFRPDDFTCAVEEMDVRPGGSYRVGVKPADEPMFYAVGTYKEVTPPERLVFTWGWTDSDYDWSNSVVTIEFIDRGRNTEVVLKHEGFGVEQSRDQHKHGWEACFDRLATSLAAS